VSATVVAGQDTGPSTGKNTGQNTARPKQNREAIFLFLPALLPVLLLSVYPLIAASRSASPMRAPG
jgi:hypothetical protein